MTMPLTALSDTELYILEYLWDINEPQTFAQLMNYFTTIEKKDWKKQTLNTFLLHLTQKGYLTLSSTGTRRLYAPSITKEEYQQTYAREIVKTSFDSSLTTFVSAFTGGQKITPQERDELLDYLKGL